MNLEPVHVLLLLTILAPLVASLLAWIRWLSTPALGYATIALSGVSLVGSTFLAGVIVREGAKGFSLFYLDALGIYFVLLVNLVAFFASWFAVQFLQSDARHNPYHNPHQFHLFFNLFHFTMLIVPMVDNLVVLWIAVELTTIFSTVLVRYRRNRASLEAAWKFIVITTTGIIFALLGTLFMANAIPPSSSPALLASSMNWSVLSRPEVASTLSPNFVILSFLFVLVGYGTKAGLAPMHTWLPDGHGEAPAPVSALLSGAMLKSALYAILRFYVITNQNLGEEGLAFTSTILMISGLLSLGLATPFILKKNRFKRILAYHSLEHMGIITFGLGIGTSLALFGALLHALNHALTKALMFMTFGSIQYEYQNRFPQSEPGAGIEENIRGVLKSMPLSGTVLAFGGLALVGSPPFNIFMSELIILGAAIHQIKGMHGSESILRILASGLFILTLTLIFGGLVGHISRLLLNKPPFEPAAQPSENIRRLLPFFLLLLIILLFGIIVPGWPVDFPELLRQSVSILQPEVIR